MTDIVDKATRSRMMSGIRGKNTKPEIAVRSYLHRKGFRFRLHRKDLPGKPDIVLPKYKLAIFVHGCFWHRHKNCKFAYTPKSNRAFWNRKFRENLARDTKNLKALSREGWRALVLWECKVDEKRLAGLDNRIIREIGRKEASRGRTHH
jgi:DNA mismatch endonuclease, patch repair protein